MPDSSPSLQLQNTQLLEIYYWLRLNRALEDRLVAMYRQSQITATVFTSRGQEATSVGSAYALGPGDFISPITRNIGSMLVRGIRPRDIFAQYMGKADSPTRGKERIHYFGDMSKGVVASLSVLGDMVPVMAGVALGARLLKTAAVALTYLGDGAVSTGDFHEGMNFAAVLGLPFVLIIENNRYAYSTPASRAAAIPDLADRAKCYGIPSEIVDGNDVIAVYEATARALARSRSGQGPAIIEAKTMRMHGHSDADNFGYVPKAELDEWAKRDPIEGFERRLQSDGVLTAGGKAEVGQRVTAEIESELSLAAAGSWPEPEEAIRGVYA